MIMAEPTIEEIAALTARLAHLSSPDATEEEREAFQDDKRALIARIEATEPEVSD